jgi:hypothetical protein
MYTKLLIIGNGGEKQDGQLKRIIKIVALSNESSVKLEPLLNCKEFWDIMFSESQLMFWRIIFLHRQGQRISQAGNQLEAGNMQRKLCARKVQYCTC